MRKSSSQYNLAICHPELAQEWDYNRNNGLVPQEITPCASKKAWWICRKCGYSWCAEVNSRHKGSGCPACANRIVWKGHNDLATKRPDLAAEWHPYNNEGLLPSDVVSRSRRTVWWKCSKCGHEWVEKVKNRNRGQGCPNCKRYLHTSFPEQALFYYLSRVFPDTISGDTSACGMELDIFIPSLRTAIEYDGYQWHKNKQVLEQKKNKLCSKHGIRLIRIREPGLCVYNNCLCILRRDNYSYTSLDHIISKVLQCLNSKPIVVNTYKDLIQIESQYLNGKGTKSADAHNINIIKYWHPTKNGCLKPEHISEGSKMKIWCQCKICGYEWLAKVAHIANGHGCPVCAGQKVLSGVNDLLTLYPSIAAEWHPIKNGALSPSCVTKGSGRRVWWKCAECGYEWQTKVHHRTDAKSPNSCPVCAKQRQQHQSRVFDQAAV